MSHSERLYLLGMKLDIQGVLLLMWSATVPLIHYSFPAAAASTTHNDHSAALRTAYHAATALLAAACSAATLLPGLSGPRLGHARAALFVAFGAGSFVAPVAHGAARCGLAEQWERIALPWIGATAAFNGVGAVAYTMKVSAKFRSFLRGGSLSCTCLPLRLPYLLMRMRMGERMGLTRHRRSSFRRGGSRGGLTCSEPAIRSCMSWLWLRHSRT